MKLMFTFRRKSTAQKEARFLGSEGAKTRVTKAHYITSKGKKRVGYHVFRG